MKRKQQLSNAAATWLNTHKDALLPMAEELDDLPDTYNEDGYSICTYPDDGDT